MSLSIYTVIGGMIGMSMALRWLVFLALITAHYEAFAQAVPAVAPDSALAVALSHIAGQPLPLSDAVAAAQTRSAPVLAARAFLDAARAVVEREHGAFDPEAFAALTRSGQDQPTSSPFSGAPVLNQKETSASAGLRMRLPIGTELSASLSAIRQATNSALSSLNPQYTTAGSVTFRQPLLSGFGAAGHKDLLAAQRQLEAAQARYDDAVLEMRAQVESRYWSLYAAERDLAVQMLVRNQAEAVLQEAQLRAKAGLVGPNQVANARVFLAEQQLALLDREEALDKASDDLAEWIGQRPQGAPRFRPVDAPPRAFDLPDADAVVADALSENRALKAVRADAAVFKALTRAADRDRLPTVDLLGSLGGNGLSGTGQEVIFGADTLRTTASGGYGDALSQVLKRDYPTWEVGVNVTIPIGNRTDKGEYRRLRAEETRADWQATAAARNLETQVRADCRTLEHGAQRLSFAREGVSAAAEQVRIGLIAYRNGQTTAFELVRLGADFASAQQRYSQALVRMARAAADLRHLTSGRYPSKVEP